MIRQYVPIVDSPPKALDTLIERFDPQAFDGPPRGARIRVRVSDVGAWDVKISGKRRPFLEAANGHDPDAELIADRSSWNSIARDVRGGMNAFQRGRLIIRHNLHLGVGLLAATSGLTDDPRRLRFETVATRAGEISTVQAGEGDPLICVHGLGATKASFLPTVSALAEHNRVIALDLPGFGDSVKPLRAPYNADYFARSVLALMDAMGIDRAHVAGNSMGGRVALELGLIAPERVGRLVLLSPALAWLRKRPWAFPLRLVRPELGVLQPAPKPVVDALVRRLVPGGHEGWTAAGVDEFLRAYHTPRGRAAFYAAARNIYLDAPNGDSGFWSRLDGLECDSLFVWGRKDTLVPIAFMHHVERTLPEAQHLELDCGHVPQLEEPVKVHGRMRKFLAELPLDAPSDDRVREATAA